MTPVERLAELKNINLKADVGSFAVLANRDMLAAVLRNLVSNAIKFSNAGDEITISARQEPDHIEISVSDSGIGMSADKVCNLFELRQRMTTEGTGGERGSGLGLILTREMVERQGSELRVRSKPGEGTTFAFNMKMADPGA